MNSRPVSMSSRRSDLSVFKKGDILAYRRKSDNAPHHMSYFGALIVGFQRIMLFRKWVMRRTDPSVTHVCLIEGQEEESHIPEKGFTSLRTVDSLSGDGVVERPAEHNYACIAYHLRDDFTPHQNFTSQELREKAVDIAMLFLRLPYNIQSAKHALFTTHGRGELQLDKSYTQWLVQAYQLEIGKDPVPPQEGVFCIELVLCSFQIAYLLMAGKEAFNQPLPPWLNHHSRSAPAAAVSFFSAHPEAYQALPQHAMLLLRYDGTPHPNDLNQRTYARRVEAVYPIHDQHGEDQDTDFDTKGCCLQFS